MAQVTTIPGIDAAPADALLPIEPRRGAILVIEDRDDVRLGLAQLLELHGFLVFEASNATEALAHLTGDPRGIALVLLDLLLPGPLSGRDLRARQLADPELAAIPAIVISSCEPDDPECATLRPVAWVEKPFRFDTLARLVKRYVIPEHGAMLTFS